MKLLRKILRFIALSLLFCFALMLAVLINFVFSTPKVALEELPPNLISLESKLGQELLAESNFRDDFPILQKNFVSQSRRAFCGVASSVIVANSINNSQPPVTQATIFNQKARQVIHPLRVTFGGMTLAQLSGILQANQLTSTKIYADKLDIKAFRSLAKKSLSNPNDFMVVNYRRTALNQTGGGHISPVAAYHQKAIACLIMDVAAYRYPPVWVKLSQLWAGINSLNRVSDRSRGLILAQK